MADEQLKQKIATLIEEQLRSEECEIADIVLSRYKRNTTLRLFVYAKDGPSLDKCAHLSRVVSDLIDGTDWFNNGYILEVSSPGLDRPLTKARDFRYRTGETVRVEFCDSSKRSMTAEILDADELKVRLQQNAEQVTIPLSEIKQARIVL